MSVNLLCKQLVIICYFVTFNKFYTQYHDTTLSKYIILLLHHVNISAERPYKSIRDDTMEFLKHSKITQYS